MKILHMTLIRRWFDEIAAGTKTEEYREIKAYWDTRLKGDYTHIKFRNGYDPGVPEMLVEYNGYEIKRIRHPITGKKERVYVLKIGRIVQLKNYNKKLLVSSAK